MSNELTMDCPHCEGEGWQPINVCCGNGAEMGECCSNPVMGQEGCATCGGSGKVARAPGTDPKTGQYSTLQMMLDEMTGGDTSQPLFD